MSTPLLSAKRVTFWPPSAEAQRADTRRERPILQNISFDLPAGTLVTIIGPSGSGKSTLLRLLNRLRDPDDGVIEYAGKPLPQWDVLELRRRIRMVFQAATMLPGTVFDNLATVSRLPGASPIERTAAAALLDKLGLPQELLDRDATQLSGGQQARVALGRALIDRPPVLLFDEVTASLDQETKKQIETFVRDLHEAKGLTALWVTHDLQQAERLGDVTWVIADGELIESGPTAHLFQNPQHEITRRLLRERPNAEAEVVAEAKATGGDSA